MAVPGNPFAQAQGIARILEEQGVFAPTSLTREDILKQREMVSGLPGLGPVDYSAESKEATDFAKLQFALSLMGRGFAAMGATPKRGESALGTLGRTMIAPIAGDISTIAGPLMKQRQAQRAAKRANEARLSQAALTMGQQRLGQEDAARDKRLALARSLTERNYTPTKGLQRTVNGKTSDFLGFVYTDKVTNLPKYVAVKNDGTLEEVPSEQLSEYRKTVAGVKATGAKREPRVILVPQADGKGGSKLVKQDVMQAVQLIPDTTTGPRTQFSPELFWKGSDQRFLVVEGNKYINPRSGTHYFPSDAANYQNPKTQRLFVRKDLTPDQLVKAKGLFGKNIEIGEGVNQHNLVHEDDPTRSLSMFDVKGRTVNITQAQADEFLTVNKPTIEEPFPAGGKPFGTTIKELTVTEVDPVTKKRTQKTIQAVLMQTAPGVFRWKETGEAGGFVAEKYQNQFWGAITDDKLYQSLRPVFDQAFQSAVGLRTDLKPEVRTKLQEHVLTQADLKRLAPLKEEERTEALNSIINARVQKLTGVTPEVVTSVPSEVFQLDPRVKAMASVPEGSTSLTRSVVNPIIFQPWTRGNKNIQLGTGSHPGFTQAVSSGDVLESRRNFPAIKQAFERAYGGTRNLGDAEEKILLFSGLWKNLPGIAERQGVITLGDSKFRTTFDKAAAKYNEAAKVFKPAADINIGKGAQAKNLQTALEDDTDALRDGMIMLRFKDQGGAWFSDGTWLAEMRGSGLGELVEAWSGTDGKERAMPSDKWDDIAKPDDQLNAADLALKRRVFEFLKETSASQNQKGAKIGLTEFERAAEYLGALSRYKIRAFSMIQDSRPSDKDIEMLLAVFVGNRDSDTAAFAKLHELQNRHVNSLSRKINQGISLNAVFDPLFLANLDHTSRALQRSSVRDVDPRPGGRAAESAKLFRRSSETIRRAAEAASGRIIPGNRGGAISPMSGNVDEEATANLYRRVLSAAKEAYPDKPDQEAVTEFVRQGLHLTGFLGVYGTSRTAAPAVRERDGSYTIR